MYYNNVFVIKLQQVLRNMCFSILTKENLALQLYTTLNTAYYFLFGYVKAIVNADWAETFDGVVEKNSTYHDKSL